MTHRLSRPGSRAALRAGAALSATCLLLLPGAAPVAAQTAAPSRSSDAAIGDAVAAVAPAVVSVTATGAGVALPRFEGMQDDRRLGEFFRRFMDEDGPRFEMPRSAMGVAGREGSGSGFFVDEGTIVTAAHLVGDADTIEVTLADGTQLEARLVGQDEATDIAVLGVEDQTGMQALGWADTEGATVGDRVFAVGRTGRFGPTVFDGIVAAVAAGSGEPGGLLLIDDAFGPATAGGPLIDASGHVVGVAGVRVGAPVEGASVAVAASVAREVVGELSSAGVVSRGYLGVRIQPVTGDVGSALGFEGDSGVLVADVQPGTPAEAAGLSAGDVILALDGEPVAGPEELSSAVAERNPGDTVTLSLWRGGDESELDVTLAALPAAGKASASARAMAGSESLPEIGLSLAEIDPALRERFGLADASAGVVVTDVQEDLPAEIDIRTGDVIVSIQRHEVTTVADVEAALQQAREDGRRSVLLLVERGGERRFVAAPIGNA